MPRKPKRHPGGRPTDYDPVRHPHLAKQLAMLGASEVQVAEALGVARSTLYLWKERHPEFSDSSREGRTLTDSRVAKSLYRRAVGMRAKVDDRTVYFPPEVNAAIFWLTNRQPAQWKHATKIEHSGSVEQRHTLDLARLSDEELVAYRALIAKAGAPQIEAGETIEVEAEEAE